MKITFVISRYYPAIGGAEFHCREIARGLSKNHEVRVLTQSLSQSEDWLRLSTIDSPRNYFYYDGNIKVDVIGIGEIAKLFLKTIYPLVGRVRGLGRIFMMTTRVSIRKRLDCFLENPDVIYAMYHGCNEFFYTETYKLARKRKIPFIFQPLSHQHKHWEHPELIYLYKHSDALLVFTESEKRWLIERGGREERIFVIPPAPLILNEESQEKLDIYKPFVLFIGRKTRGKGFFALIDAARIVLKEKPDTKFVFIGYDPPEAQEVWKKEKDKRIINLGVVDDFKKVSFLKSCEIFCLPSKEESCGIAYLEAWRFKKPLIACDIPSSRELIKENEDGILVEQTPESIARALLKLLKDDELRKRLGEAGYKKSLKFSWKRSIEKTEEVIKLITQKS